VVAAHTEAGRLRQLQAPRLQQGAAQEGSMTRAQVCNIERLESMAMSMANLHGAKNPLVAVSLTKAVIAINEAWTLAKEQQTRSKPAPRKGAA
jgi:hypothetical protein